MRRFELIKAVLTALEINHISLVNTFGKGYNILEVATVYIKRSSPLLCRAHRTVAIEVLERHPRCR